MRFEKNERLQHLLLILLMDITILGVIIISGFSSIYAATNHKARIEVVGANPAEVQWFNSTDKNGCTGNPSDWIEEYTLETDMDTVFNDIDGDDARRNWVISTADFQKYGTLTGISLAKKDDGTVLQFVKANDKNAGLTTDDISTKLLSNKNVVWITSDPDNFVPTGVKNSYALYGMIQGADTSSDWSSSLGDSYCSIETCYANTDTFDHVITLYFNGAEDAPVIPEVVKAVIDKIDKIGEVTEENYLSKESDITAARDAFDALVTDELKAQVTNYNTLTDAEIAFNAFKLAAAKTAAISELEGEFDKSLYSGDELAKLNQAIENGKKAINAATSEDTITVAKTNALEEARKAKTDKEIADEKDAEIAKKKAAAKKYTIKGLKVKAKSRKFIVSWKKTAGATGYQVQYKLKSAKKYKTLKTLKKLNVTSKKLKKGKKYQFKVRTYTFVKGTKVYGKWTKVKTVKCK